MTPDVTVAVLAPGSAASSRLSVIRGTVVALELRLVDGDNEPIDVERLAGASAELLVRVAPTDTTNVLRFTTTDTPSSLSFKPDSAALLITFAALDTSSLALLVYNWQLQVTLADGAVYDVVAWSPFDLNLGGTAVTPPPPFDNTVKVDHNYQLSDELTYITPGGSPIENAQIRLYAKADYDAGRLEAPVGTTTTDAGGRWRNPILVAPGYTYVVRYEKPYEYGPDVKEIWA